MGDNFLWIQEKGIRSNDFYEELKEQFFSYYKSVTGTEINLKTHFLFLDSYHTDDPDKLCLAEFLTPDNIGNYIEIRWDFDKDNLTPNSFSSEKDKINFQFSELDIENIKRFIEPNLNPPFTVKNYSFKFHCLKYDIDSYPGDNFKDNCFYISLSKNNNINPEDIYNEIMKEIAVWLKENPGEHIGQLHWNAVSNYEITFSIDIEGANREILSAILDAINSEEFNRQINKVELT